MIIQTYKAEYKDDVVALWRKCNLLRPWNNAEKDIKRKLKVNPGLFLLGLNNKRVIATIIGGYDGHRGWVNYLAVDPAFQKKGLGRELMEELEKKLRALGCPKINLQIRTTNRDAIQFYESIGYQIDKVTSMGKRLEKD